MEFLLGLVLLVLGVYVYFLPTWFARDKGRLASIFVLNLFLGWTLVGWVGAMVWAVWKND